MKNISLTLRDTDRFREILETESAGILRALQNRGGAAIEFVSEECEQMALAGQRDLVLALVDRTLRRLRDVESALRRIERGDFGACIDCGEPIAVSRLTAIPWASRCLLCQEIADRNRAPDLFVDGGLGPAVTRAQTAREG